MTNNHCDVSVEILIRAAQGSDPHAVEQLIERCLPQIRACVRLNTSDGVRIRESSSDLVQTVCREVLRNLQQFEWRGEGSFKAWLQRSVLNKIKDRERYHFAEMRNPAREVEQRSRGRDDSRMLELYGTIRSPSENAIAHEEMALLEAAFDQLPANHREIITLAKIVGLTHAEIAGETGQTPHAVRSMLYRALVRLVVILDKIQSGEDSRQPENE